MNSLSSNFGYLIYTTIHQNDSMNFFHICFNIIAKFELYKTNDDCHLFDIYLSTQTTFFKQKSNGCLWSTSYPWHNYLSIFAWNQTYKLKPFSNHVQIVISLELFWRLHFYALRCKKMVSRLCTHTLLFDTSYNFANVAKHTITTWKLQLQFSLSCLIRF